MGAAEEFQPIGTTGATPARWTEGKFGKALQFEGVCDPVNCGHADALTSPDAITVAFWLKAEEWIHQETFLQKAGLLTIQKRQTDDAGGVYFNLAVGGQMRNAIWDPKNHMKLTRGAWHHIVLTYDSATATANCYLDGRTQSSLT